MAFYVLLLKEREDETEVVYRFGPGEDRMGSLRLDKASGMVHELEAAHADDPLAVFRRAAVKVRQHWTRQEFPDRTVWAS